MRIPGKILLVLASLVVFHANPAFAAGGGGKEKKVEAPPPGIRPASFAAPNFVEFTASAATVFNRYRPTGLLHFEYGLDLKGDVQRDYIVKLAPRLREAYTNSLVQYAGGVYVPGDVPDVAYLATRMQAITDRIAGPGKAKFLLTSVMVSKN